MNIAHVRRVQTALIGFGPANLGLLIAAIRRGDLPRMARSGIAIIEAGDRLGCGTIGTYRITANSLASVFLECVDDPHLGSLLEVVKTHPKVARFRFRPDVAPHLEDVAEILEAMAEAVISYLSTRVDLTVLRGARATSWTKSEGQHVFDIVGSAGRFRLVSEAAFVNCGGQSRIIEATEAIPALRTVASHDILRMDEASLLELLHGSDGTVARVAILGGSHSAISCAQRISAATSNANINIFGHGPVRLFYASESDAVADEYYFDPERDVCPLSGRVNRFGGLRYDAHRAACEMHRSGRIFADGPPVSFHWDEKPSTAARHSGPFSLVVVAAGYDALGPCGRTLRSHIDGRVRDDAGRVIPNLYSFGLGSGLIPSSRIGGEPAYRGRLDGYWLYQNDVGDEVLDAHMADQKTSQLI